MLGFASQWAGASAEGSFRTPNDESYLCPLTRKRNALVFWVNARFFRIVTVDYVKQARPQFFSKSDYDHGVDLCADPGLSLAWAE